MVRPQFANARGKRDRSIELMKLLFPFQPPRPLQCRPGLGRQRLDFAIDRALGLPRADRQRHLIDRRITVPTLGRERLGADFT